MTQVICSRNGNCTIVNVSGKKYVLNYRMSSPDKRDFVYQPQNLEAKHPFLTYRDKMPPIWDQGDIGSCVAQSLASTLMFCMRKPFIPSRLFIYFCARTLSNIDTNSDTGVEMRMGCKAITKYGFCNENLHPYQERDFSLMPSRQAFKEALSFTNYVYESIPIDTKVMMKVLDEGHPFVIGIMVHKSMFEPKTVSSGNIPVPVEGEEVLGGHAITIVGYDKSRKVFMVRNSWGEKWGDKGYGTIPFEYLGNPHIALDSWVLRCKPHH